MSDKSSIFVRYNINYRETDDEPFRPCTGIMGNHYRGLDVLGMVTRPACGIEYFLVHANWIEFYNAGFGTWADFEEYFRRAFDIDFICHDFAISFDAGKAAREHYQNHEINELKISEDFFFCDTDFGQMLIDISGTVDGRQKKLNVKYAYLDNIYSRDNIYDVDEYYRHHELAHRTDARNIDDEEYRNWLIQSYAEQDKLFETGAEYIKNHASLMNREEVDEFCNTDIYQYLFASRLREDEQEIEEDISFDELEIDDSEKVQDRLLDEMEPSMSVRLYNCAKRAGYTKLSDFKGKSVEDLMEIRNIGKTCLRELLQILNRYGIHPQSAELHHDSSDEIHLC